MFRETVHRRRDHKANTPRRNLFLERRKQQHRQCFRHGSFYPSWSVVGDCRLYSAGPCCLHPAPGTGWSRLQSLHLHHVENVLTMMLPASLHTVTSGCARHTSTALLTRAVSCKCCVNPLILTCVHRASAGAGAGARAHAHNITFFFPCSPFILAALAVGCSGQ